MWVPLSRAFDAYDRATWSAQCLSGTVYSHVGAALASGAFGVTYPVWASRAGRWVVKVVPLYTEADVETFRIEAYVAEHASEHAVGPEVGASVVCQNRAPFWRTWWRRLRLEDPPRRGYGLLVQARMDGTLLQLQDQRPPAASFADTKALVALVERLHRHGILHGDLHSSNLMYRTAPDGRRTWLCVDFGLAWLVRQWSATMLWLDSRWVSEWTGDPKAALWAFRRIGGPTFFRRDLGGDWLRPFLDVLRASVDPALLRTFGWTALVRRMVKDPSGTGAARPRPPTSAPQKRAASRSQ